MNLAPLLFTILLLSAQPVFAANSSNSPGTIVSDSSVGTAAWTNPGNAVASNNSYTTGFSLGLNVATQYLKATNFGFSIPDGVTIDGIEAKVERNCEQSYFSCMKDTKVRIVKGGSIGSTDKADTGTTWPTSDAIKTYGNSTDLWGETWTASDINGSDFGFALATTTTIVEEDFAIPRIDHIQITVYYTESVPDLSTWAMLFLLIGGVCFLHREGLLKHF